jgi:hypothetical protein
MDGRHGCVMIQSNHTPSPVTAWLAHVFMLVMGFSVMRGLPMKAVGYIEPLPSGIFAG